MTRMIQITPEELSKKYVKDALPVALIISIVSAVVICSLCFTPLLHMMSTVALTIIGICFGVAFLFAICRVILVLVLAGIIKSGKYTIEQTLVLKYQFYTTRRLAYLYAVLDNNKFCNVWTSPFYSKGTEVYFVSLNGSLMKNEVIIRV